MKTIKVKGKDYVPVSERVKEAHARKIEGMTTTYQFIEGERMFIVTASVTINGKTFTGHAQEVIGQTSITKTKSLEKCETTAIGRALAFAGIGIDTAIASADEVADIIHSEMITDQQKSYIESLLSNSVLDYEMRARIAEEYADYSRARAKKCIEYLQENQLSPMDRHGTMSQKEISQAVKDQLENERA